MIWSYVPPSSKCVFCAAFQLPKTSSTVKVSTFGNSFACAASTFALRGRSPCFAAISWPSSEYSYCR